MSRPTYDVRPHPSMLPVPERQAACAAALTDLPGIDVYQSIEHEQTDTWPPDALYVTSHVRPGFNGNVTVRPYRTIEYDDVRSAVMQRGSKLFSMVYENPAWMHPSAPWDREMPDFVSLDGPGMSEVVRLQNGGRLLVEPHPVHVTSLGAGANTMHKYDMTWEGVVRSVRIARRAELQPLLAVLATGMGLEGQDAATFVEQPDKKIIWQAEPAPAPPQPVKSGWFRWLSRG